MLTDIYNIIIDSLFLQTWVGALCAQLLSLNSNEFNGTIPFVKKVVPNKSDTFYFRMDFLLLPLIGALLAYVLLDPTSFKTSVFSGLSWSGTLIAMLKGNKNKI